MKRSKAGILLICLAACGDDSSLPPAPPELTVTLADGSTLTVTTDPLALRVTRGAETVLDAPAFVEVGVVDEDPPSTITYWDPADPQSRIRFRVATRATGWEEASRTLHLALDGAGGGEATLVVADDGTLTLATTGTPGAVLARFVVPVGAGEDLYGFGWRLDSPATRQQVREMQFRIDLAVETSLNEIHAPIPLAIYPRRQLALFAEERRPGAFDVGAGRAGAVLVTYASASLKLHFLAGPPLALLDLYTQRTGRPHVPPDWSFAPMQWRNVHDDAAQVISDAQTIRDLDIPGSIVWVDNPWQTGYNTFEFDPVRFPDPAGMIAQLRALGFRTFVWSTPYVNPTGATADDFVEARDLGYLVGDETGQPFVLPWQDGPGALVDFTRPGATAWWRERIARVTDLGISGFKLDFGEELVPELGGNRTPFTLAAGGSDEWHNHYAGVYHDAYLNALPPGEGFVLTRAGAWGEQTTNSCIWGSDLESDFTRWDGVGVGGLPSAISIGLSLSSSGYPFFGSDIGGFRGFPTTEVLLRWAQYAALGTHMQLGGGGDSHNPWDTTLFGPEALPIYTQYARLHTDLFPYLYTYAVRAGATGAPVTRAPGLLYPDHPYEDAFLTGEALFVAPVVEAGATTRTVTLPPGDWVDWWTGELTAGGGQVMVAAPLDTLPLWQQVGAIVVMLATPIDTLIDCTSGCDSFETPANSRGLRVLVAPAAATTFALHDGASVTAEGLADRVVVQATAGTIYQDFRFELDWTHSPAAAVTPTMADVPLAADLAAFDACAAPGCWFDDPVSGRVLVRLVGGGTATVQ